MAESLLRAKLPLVVYDIDPDKNRRFQALGARVGAGPADVARQAARVVVMVDTTAQAEEVCVQDGGIIDGASAGDIVISMCTIDPRALQRMGTVLAGRGVGIIDAPVTGAVKAAKAGTLKALVGGDASHLEACRPVLSAMASEIIHVGALGQGLVLKLVNNMLYKVNSLVAIEGIVLGVRAGIDLKLMVDVIGGTTGNSAAFQYRAKRLLERDFEVGSEGVRLDVSYNNMALECALGQAFKVPMFLPATCLQIFEMGRAAGLGDQDATALVTLYEKITGVHVGPAPCEGR